MPYCAGCGRELSPGNFCPRCGRPVASAEPDMQRLPATWYPGGPQPRYAAPPADELPYPPPATAVSRRAVVPAPRVLVCACIAAISMGAVIAASFLPWVTYSGISIGGLRRGGRLLLALGLLGIVSSLVAMALKSRWPFGVLMVLGAVVAGVMVTNIIDVTGTAGLSLSNVGAGLFLGAVAGTVAVVTGAAGASLRPSPPLP